MRVRLRMKRFLPGSEARTGSNKEVRSKGNVEEMSLGMIEIIWIFKHNKHHDYYIVISVLNLLLFAHKELKITYINEK